jgi:hypothetical protein
MKMLKFASLTVAALTVAAFVFMVSGTFDVAADNPHWSGTQWLLEVAPF